MGRNELINQASTLAVSLRMGEGIDLVALRRFRSELAKASSRWNDAGQVSRSEAAVLVEFFPALYGCVPLYPEDVAREVAELCECLLNEVLSALAEPEN
ncbi:hypothetical protein AADG42_08470 [Ammonicoccus fulvus]|uniref:Uncharacterized protein n=1 Tax=Ammonicoccus fulvus TaxID=3138240 RepID=A0ABZ3FQ72_9ACTN